RRPRSAGSAAPKNCRGGSAAPCRAANPRHSGHSRRLQTRSAPPSCARVAPSSADVLPEAAGFLPAGVCLQEKVIEMLRRPEGATVDEVVRATAWQRHTVRGVFLVRQFEEILNIWPQFGFKGGLRQH